MRDPFLINSPGTRQVQHEMGLLYDSTINEHWTKDGLWPTSANGSSRLWPCEQPLLDPLLLHAGPFFSGCRLNAKIAQQGSSILTWAVRASNAWVVLDAPGCGLRSASIQLSSACAHPRPWQTPWTMASPRCATPPAPTAPAPRWARSGRLARQPPSAPPEAVHPQFRMPCCLHLEARHAAHQPWWAHRPATMPAPPCAG